MNAQELIRKKRDGAQLSVSEIDDFVAGVTAGAWADYQTSALLMAIFIKGLSLAEQNALTGAMLASGEILDFSDIGAPVADKHSTGGVGDKTSLLIAPIAAACGVAVPMISGRGLGHTGGTLDKLESIAGYNVNLSAKEFKRTVKKCGFALAGQTAKIVPADRKLYALRDATATVESIPLIVASIMSKKMAEGLDALILDVKTGTGAFMQSDADARRLAEALVETGKAFNVRTEAVVSDMNQPLGEYVGNRLEVYECVKILRGETSAEMLQTKELTLELTARMLVLTGVAADVESGRAMCSGTLKSGAAFEKFRQNVELQGGNPNVCDKPETLLEKKLFEFEIKAESSGFVRAIDTTIVGQSVSDIGGGRRRVEDTIDFGVGYRCIKKIGDAVNAGDTLGVVICRSDEQSNRIAERLRAAYVISEEKPPESALIKEIIS